ncbi:MAG: AI-2E family transporter [Pyrinomonadaceae bacterium]
MTYNPITGKTYVSQVFIAVGVILLTAILAVLVYLAFDIILLVFAAALLAIFLRGLADIVRGYVDIGEGISVLVVSTILAIVIAGSVALLAPSVADQVVHLREQLPRSAQQLSDYFSRFDWGQAIIAQLPGTAEVMQKVEISSLLTRVGGYFSSTVGAIGNFFITILLAVYLAAEPRFYSHGFIRLFPIPKRHRVSQVLSGINETLRWWMMGKIGSMIFIGVLTWLGLSLIGVPLALTLGLIAGLLSFIPNFGPIISAIPAILLAFIASPVSALYAAILYIGVQLVESNLVTPIIERKTVELPPALTIIFQLALGVMIGGLGLVLATPLLAMLMVIVQMVYVQDILGDWNNADEDPIQASVVDSSPTSNSG